MEINVIHKILQKNDNAARENRDLLAARGVFMFNLLGGAGSGKTSLLEAVLPRLHGRVRVGVIEGDLATTRDAQRIAVLGVPVVQVLTDGGCHLSATLVQEALRRLPLDRLDGVIIENVGNPICPANFDLGEHIRLSLLSVTEGDDKPSKYPLLFKDAALIALTKCDLLPHVPFDPMAAIADLRRVNNTAEIVKTDIRGGTGMDRLADWMAEHVLGEAAVISQVQTSMK